MRLKIHFSKNTQPIPFNYKELVVGTIYKWLGDKSDLFHGRKYQKLTISDLYGSKIKNNNLDFINGGYFLISSSDVDLLYNLMIGIQNNPSMFNGLNVTEISKEKTPNFEKQIQFKTKSMIFIKDDNNQFVFPDNEKYSEIVKNKINAKLKFNNFQEDDTIEIIFKNNYKIKNYNYKGIHNKGVVGEFIILAKPETKKFLYENGLGNSCGIGFGCIE